MKGAIISFDIASPIPQIIMFQYNPALLSRTLKTRSSGGAEGSPTEAFRLSGPPEESIDLDIELDATDNLEHPDQNKTTTSLGIYPQLSALEMILYPKSALVIANAILANIGTIEIVSPEGPFTLFVWGPKRVLPVRITSFKITEEAHDVNLNPIQAKVSLGLQVLSYNDLSLTHPGYTVFLAHQIIKETMAAIGSINSSLTFGGEFNLSASANIKVG